MSIFIKFPRCGQPFYDSFVICSPCRQSFHVHRSCKMFTLRADFPCQFYPILALWAAFPCRFCNIFAMQAVFPCSSCKIVALWRDFPCQFYKILALRATLPCLFLSNFRPVGFAIVKMTDHKLKMTGHKLKMTGGAPAPPVIMTGSN